MRTRQAISVFEAGLTFEDYLASMENLQDVAREQYQSIEIPADLAAQFSAAAVPRGGVRVLVLTEDFCPDSAMNLPIVACLCESDPALTLRVARRSEHESLAALYLASDGINHIPTVILIDGENEEIGVWQERSAAAHAFIAELEAKSPRPESQLPDGSDNPAFAVWRAKRLVAQKRAYRDGLFLWRETARELLDLLAV